MTPYIVVLPPHDGIIPEPKNDPFKPTDPTKSQPKESSKSQSKEPSEDESPSIEEPSLKYKTWVLKVAIHCQGCKKKIKRILCPIEGVYETNIDLKKQKVTVLGNVELEAETLIKKLVKAGKNAELWPEEEKKEQEKEKDKDKEKEPMEESDTESDEDDVPVEVPVPVVPKKKNVDVPAGKPKDGKKEAPKPADAAGTTDGGGKKKKKKERKKTGESEACRVVDTNQRHVQFLEPQTCQVVHIPSRPCYASAALAYAGFGRGTAFYVPNYAAGCSRLLDCEAYPSSPPDSFHAMSDENPNSCHIM